MPDSDAVGYFFTYRFVEQGVAAGAALAAALLPLMARRRVRGSNLGREAWLALAVSMAAAAVIPVATVILANRATVELDSYVVAALASSVAIAGVNYILGLQTMLVGKAARLIWVNLVALAFNVVANILTLAAFGARGAATITLLTEAVVLSSVFVVLRAADAAPGWALIACAGGIPLATACASAALETLAVPTATLGVGCLIAAVTMRRSSAAR